MGKLSLRARAIGLAMVVVLTLLASYVVVGREYVAALDTFVVQDPTLGFTASRSAAPSGTVVHLAGAPAGALAEFSGDGVLAYSPTFADGAGLATVVPPIIGADGLVAGDVKLRLLAQRGPIWSSSAKTLFKVEASPHAGGALGVATLFGLEVTRELLLRAAESAAIAVAAGAPNAVSDHAAALAQLRLETEALAAEFEAIPLGKSTSITRSGLGIDAAGIRLMDQLIAPYFTSLGPASPSPCGDTKDAQARAGLAATSVTEAKASAALFVRSVIDCDQTQMGDISARTSAWLAALGHTIAEALRAQPNLPKHARVLVVAVTSWLAEATNATYLWKGYERGADLRRLLERDPKFMLGAGDELYVTIDFNLEEGDPLRQRLRVPEYLQAAVERDPYLSAQIERLRKQSAFEKYLLESVMAQDDADQAHVAQALQAREPTPTPTASATASPTPSPTPTPSATPTPTPTAVPATAAPTLVVVSLPPTPAALSYSLIAPPALKAGQAVTFSFCAPRPTSATALCGPGSSNPKGGNPPYTFTYGVPRPFGLTFNSNGLVTGTPTTSGPFNFEVCVKDLSGASICRNTVGNVAVSPTPQPAACAGTSFAGTTWAGNVDLGDRRPGRTTYLYVKNIEITFGQPIVYPFGGCDVPIVSVRVDDPERTWALNTTYSGAGGQFNKVSCSATACTDFALTLELRSGPSAWGSEYSGTQILHVYSVTTVSPSTISGNAGLGAIGGGGCCGPGTFSLGKR